MAEGGSDKEEEVKEKMQGATAKLFEKRSQNAETIQTDSTRIAMPSLSNKWQTIIDDTLIPRMSNQNTDSAVRKRSKSITPEDEDFRSRKPRPVSMPSVASPLPLELYDEEEIHPDNAEQLENEDKDVSPRRSKPPARLQPLGHPPPGPPSYDEAIKINEKHPLPQTLPFYGRLWQKGRHWQESAIDSNGAAAFSTTAPLPPILKDSGANGSTNETSLTDIERAPSRISNPNEGGEYSAVRRDEFDIEEGRSEAKKSPECDNCFGSRFPRVVQYLQSLTLQKMLILVTVAVVLIVLVIFLGVFPASFVYVEYHEMALLKNKITGSVDRDHVYYTGCYVLGPDKEFVRYPINANTISETAAVVTSDRLEVVLSYHLQYYIRGNELGDLHREYEKDYDSVISKVVVSEIKNKIARFNLDYFRLQRPTLEKYILSILQTRLEGDCCQSCCPNNCANNTACTVCLPATTCHPGYHVDVKYFQLIDLDIPDQVSNLYVRKLILQVEAEKEFLLQEHAVVAKETNRLTQALKNEANEILEEAKAVAAKTLRLAEANREANLTAAYVYGLQSMYSMLGVTNEDHKLSLMMMKALDDMNVKGKLYKGYGYNMSTIATVP